MITNPKTIAQGVKDKMTFRAARAQLGNMLLRGRRTAADVGAAGSVFSDQPSSSDDDATNAAGDGSATTAADGGETRAAAADGFAGSQSQRQFDAMEEAAAAALSGAANLPAAVTTPEEARTALREEEAAVAAMDAEWVGGLESASPKPRGQELGDMAGAASSSSESAPLLRLPESRAPGLPASSVAGGSGGSGSSLQGSRRAAQPPHAPLQQVQQRHAATKPLPPPPGKNPLWGDMSTRKAAAEFGQARFGSSPLTEVQENLLSGRVT